MKRRRTHYFNLLIALATLLSAVAAQAAVTIVDLGTAAPVGTLGSWTMTPFPDDPSLTGNTVSSVNGPGGAFVAFDNALMHDEVGVDWATWSHGYTGDVYDTIGVGNSVVLTLPNDTRAFYFYAEPTQWAPFDITATDENGGTLTVNVTGGGGANGFGFYTDAADAITKITVTTGDLDFALGEFGIATGNLAVPDGGSTLLCAVLGLLPLWGLHRRRQRTT